MTPNELIAKWRNLHTSTGAVSSFVLRKCADELEAALGQAEEVPSESMNQDLCDFASSWVIDGDYMRCRACNRPQIASCAGMVFPHASYCTRPDQHPHPWQYFASLIRQLPAPPAAEGLFDE